MEIRCCLFCVLLVLDFLSVDMVKAVFTHDGYLWCDYQFVLEKMQWKDAHAACKQYNKTLVYLSDSAHYESVKTLIKSSVTSILPPGKTIESTVWVGLHLDYNNIKRYDNCQQYAPAGAFDPATTHNAGCFLFDMNTADQKYTTAPCADMKQFLCKAKVHDTANCFTEKVHAQNYLSGMNKANACPDPTDVYTYCTKDCVGFTKDGGMCSYVEFAADGQRPNQVYYTKGLLVTSLPILINPAIDITSVCGGGGAVEPTSSVTPSSSIAQLVTSESSSINTSPISGSAFCTTSSIFPISHYSSQSTCFCACGNSTNVTMTSEELKEKIQELRDELIVKKDDLSSHKRKLISAPDDRASAKNIGYVGAVFLGMVFVAIVLIDVPRMMAEVRSVTQALCGLKGSNPQVVRQPNHSNC